MMFVDLSPLQARPIFSQVSMFGQLSETSVTEAQFGYDVLISLTLKDSGFDSVQVCLSEKVTFIFHSFHYQEDE